MFLSSSMSSSASLTLSLNYYLDSRISRMSYNSKTSKSTNIPKIIKKITSNSGNIILIFDNILNQREKNFPQKWPLFILVKSEELCQILPNITDIREFLLFDNRFLLFGDRLRALEVLFREPAESTRRQITASTVSGVQIRPHLGHLGHWVHSTHLRHLRHHGRVHVHEVWKY
jgi:hypothetical protein